MNHQGVHDIRIADLGVWISKAEGAARASSAKGRVTAAKAPALERLEEAERVGYVALEQDISPATIWQLRGRLQRGESSLAKRQFFATSGVNAINAGDAAGLGDAASRGDFDGSEGRRIQHKI